MITLSSRTQSGTGEDGIGDEKYSADTKSNGIDCEDEDIVLSPGFDAMQAQIYSRTWITALLMNNLKQHHDLAPSHGKLGWDMESLLGH
jgi:hypothetical protein